jgi:non-heme chloroperoxidase
VTPVVSMVTLESGVKLSSAVTGDPSGPALVLLPGPTDSWRSYEPVLRYLPASICAIAVSQRGHGDSDKPPTGYRVEDFAADVELLLDALGIEGAILAGHSGSCLAARRVALDHPERVSGLVLEASPSTLRRHARLTELVESLANLQDAVDATFARSFVADTSSEQLAPELVDELVIEVMKVPAHVWKEMFAALLAYDDLVELDRIIAPTLLVWATLTGSSIGICRRCSRSASAAPSYSSTTVWVTLRGGRIRAASPTRSPRLSNDEHRRRDGECCNGDHTDRYRRGSFSARPATTAVQLT